MHYESIPARVAPHPAAPLIEAREPARRDDMRPRSVRRAEQKAAKRAAKKAIKREG